MKTVALILDIVHIIVSITMLVLMPVLWADELLEEACL